MQVTFISECTKNANKRTRRILDAFADRIGKNTWQTIITEEGLVAVRKLLRESASKNTAVSCHWRRSYNRTDLLWIVGNRNRFNAEGIVPVNWTMKGLTKETGFFKNKNIIALLSGISGFFHDMGKANELFQDKLNPLIETKIFEPYRHEWVSLRLFQAFVNDTHEKPTDESWLNRLINAEINEETLKNVIKGNTKSPLAKLPIAANMISWLIVSHHRIPTLNLKTDKEAINHLKLKQFTFESIKSNFSYENKFDEADFNKRIKDCLTFSNGLLSDSSKWLNEVKKWAQKLLLELPNIKQSIDDGSYRLILNHSRLSLMLGNHFYSSQDADKRWKNSKLFANTDSDGEYKQRLDEHLVGVAKSVLRINQLLPMFEKELEPAYDNSNLNKKSPKAFSWQDKAVNKII